ncbi:glycosyltransferase [Archangium sp.]|uniref:glycosyltransferase n=1 Tax=Archangium sp. TaxID=1872627 RepID=UPI002D44D6AF|nr:glycosyltransferase [Archangium sp.]HYO55501.1 glycosyltransferase [Archangium sp.]
MSTILFVPMPERGHINPSLKIARALQKRGHRIIYCSLRDTEELIRAEGFEFECLFEHLYPKGFQTEIKARLGRLSGLPRLAYMRELVRKQTGMLESMLQGEFDRIISRTRPDLGITDVLLPEMFLVLHGHRVPALLLNTSIPLRWELMTPPPTSGCIPDGRLPSMVRGAVDWGRVLLDAKLGSLSSWVGLEPDGLKYRRALARKHGYPLSGLDFAGRPTGEHNPMLILCPREFVEFRGSKLSIDYHYTGPSIDLQRQEPDFPWERLDGERPLVVCSLGTMAIQPEQARRFHQSIADAARRRPRWQFVVATNQWKEETPGQAPANLVAVQHVPQLQMLRRASAMVTHGGFNSVKECIYFGVPMVVLPVQFDQPGVAARVVHHGLGVRSSINELTPDTLTHLLDEVVEKPSYRRELGRMQALFQAAEQEQAMAEAIEKHLL